MLKTKRIRSKLFMGLILLGLETTAVAQFEQYACGVDDAADVGQEHVTEMVRNIVSESVDDVSAVQRASIGSRIPTDQNSQDILLQSAEAVRRKLRSDRTKIPATRRRIQSAGPDPVDAPAVLDTQVRNSKHWQLLPTVKPLNQWFSRHPNEEEGSVEHATYTEPLKPKAESRQNSKALARHMTPEELAAYIKHRRSQPWWRRGR